MKKSATASLFLAALMGLVLAGCQTTRQAPPVTTASVEEKDYGSLAVIEETIIRLDAAGAGREELAEARRQIAAQEGTRTDPHFEALLAAWSGRLYLMEGKISAAQREYRVSQNLSPRNMPARILSFRLERDLSRRLSMIDSALETESSSGELLMERGRALFDLNRFSESVAAFDAAQLTLTAKPYYEEAYRVFRDKAWELKDLEQAADSNTVTIARQGEINWKDLIEITRSETDLLRFITAGRNWPAETLFNQLLERAFIPYTQDAALTEWPAAKPSSGEPVLRSGAAWFLWHLYAENRANRGLLTRYSSRFINLPNPKSPIADVGVRSPFLDSVLGCVESEFMALPDGRNFMPQERVKGSEYLGMVKKLQP